MADDAHLVHDAHMARLQRVLDRLEQVTKQAKDLARMSAELQEEAGESIKLVKAAARQPRSQAHKRAKRR
jgi:hypothetical protein